MSLVQFGGREVTGLLDAMQKYYEAKARPPSLDVAAAGGDNSPSVIENVRNRIYFYSDITRHDILQLVRTLKDLDAGHISGAYIKGVEEFTPIWLHINSYGGAMFHGFSGMDNIAMCKSPVYTIVDGVCASAATFLSLVGDKRYITRHSMMLIHQLSSGFWGKYAELEDQKQNMDMFMDMIRAVYKEHTKIPIKKLDKILKHDLFFSSEQCLEYGMVDEII